jgi:hypothetical protein
MVDNVLALVASGERLYAGLANGSIGVIENSSGAQPQPSTLVDMYYVPLGPAPITCVLLVDTCLWLTMANKVVVLNIKLGGVHTCAR